MKKGIILIAALAAVLACVLVLGCTAAPKTPEAIEPVQGRGFMRAELAYDEGLRTLRGTQTLTIQNETGSDLENIVLRAYMNGWEGCSVKVSGVSVNAGSVPFSQDEEDSTVLTIDYPWRAGEEIVLAWSVMIKHARQEGPSVILLPSPAMAEGGVWRTDAYDDLADPSYAEPFDVVIELDGRIAAQARMARDAGFVLGGKEKEREVSGVRIRAAGKNAGAAKALLAQGEAALKSLAEAGIPYPGDMLTIADCGAANGEDMALSGLIALDAQGDREALLRRITCLIARQTFGIQVENDPWNAPWLSHTLASCAEMLAYRQRKGAAAYEARLYGELELATRLTRPAGVTVGAGTAHFGSASEMVQVLGDQGAAMLLGIEQAVGAQAFSDALAMYISENTGKTGSLQALCSALEQASGSSWDGYLADMLAF